MPSLLSLVPGPPNPIVRGVLNRPLPVFMNEGRLETEVEPGFRNRPTFL